MRKLQEEIADCLEVDRQEMPEKKLWASIVLISLTDLTGIKSITNTTTTDQKDALKFFLANDNPEKVGTWAYCKNILGLSSNADKIVKKLIYKYRKLDDSFGLN